MNDKVLVIIGTAERAKAQAGAMYAVNALEYDWLADQTRLIPGLIRDAYVPMVW